MDTTKHTALISGGNRGIGFEICRQLGRLGHQVVLTSRNQQEGEAAAKKLQNEGLNVVHHQLDISDTTSIAACVQWLEDQKITIDILINNAAILSHSTILDTDETEMTSVISINSLGAWRLCKAFVPSMVKRGYGRVVSISSGYGQISSLTPGQGPSSGAYGISKTTLNAISRQVAASVLGHNNIKVNVMCPGWVATQMGGTGAPTSPSEAASFAVQLVTLPADGPTDTFFRYGKQIPW
jgi:NAD(P)-dependent dehydrogenase (short-subunit alcohol dehydrogenase family)